MLRDIFTLFGRGLECAALAHVLLRDFHKSTENGEMIKLTSKGGVQFQAHNSHSLEFGRPECWNT